MGRFMVFEGVREALDVLSGYIDLGRAEACDPFDDRVMGISPDTGVGSRDEDDLIDRSSPRSRDLVDGDNCGARCDLRLCLSIMLIVQASKSTGVRFAACKNGSVSWYSCQQRL